tara:strand:- start:214 stop:318 length:105 start_codon:yes stop_codon:yes gene_type:complete
MLIFLEPPITKEVKFNTIKTIKERKGKERKGKKD